LLKGSSVKAVAVRATGLIRFFEEAVAMLDAGADRLGTTH